MTRSPVLTVSWLAAGRSVVETRTRFGAVALLIVGLAVANPAEAAPDESAEPRGSAGSGEVVAPTAPPTAGSEPPPPKVDIDRLLRLPTSYTSGSYDDGAPRQRGATASDWRRRFAEADEALDGAKRNLSDAQSKLEHTAADSAQWQMGAPGLGTPDADHATVSYKLRAQIRTLRDELEVAEKKRKDLAIEADLAGVPDTWRRPSGEAEPVKRGAPRELPSEVYQPSGR